MQRTYIALVHKEPDSDGVSFCQSHLGGSQRNGRRGPCPSSSAGAQPGFGGCLDAFYLLLHTPLEENFP